MIRNWEAGMFAVTETIYYKSVAKSVDIDVTTVADGLRLYTAGGKEIAVDELDSYAAARAITPPPRRSACWTWAAWKA